MSFWKILAKPPWRTVALGSLFLLILLLAYCSWSPGVHLKDGRHDLRSNGIWLQHGWLGSDDWFKQNNTNHPASFRNPACIRELAVLLRRHHISDVFPHLCPADIDGQIPAVDSIQTENFLREFHDFRVMPWIGGPLNLPVRLHDRKWRQHFVASINALLVAHTNFAGVHLNIEPLPSGNKDFLILLDEIHAALPQGKILSIAAYPPPTRWQPSLEVHWEEAYFREVARRADQLVVMMYDTSINRRKIYQSTVASWTGEVLDWSAQKKVLLGVPAYLDQQVAYHDPRVENISTALPAIHRGLSNLGKLPPGYQGVALYCEWEMDAAKWDYFREHFLKPD